MPHSARTPVFEVQISCRHPAITAIEPAQRRKQRAETSTHLSLLRGHARRGSLLELEVEQALAAGLGHLPVKVLQYRSIATIVQR
jgi:hypothetical protein